jgi:hypothetical protein
MLLSDLIQAVGVLIQVRWAYLGYVETSTACWVQAAMVCRVIRFTAGNSPVV